MGALSPSLLGMAGLTGKDDADRFKGLALAVSEAVFVGGSWEMGRLGSGVADTVLAAGIWGEGGLLSWSTSSVSLSPSRSN